MRLRITYTKDEPIKYISHLDMVRMFDRAIRRSGIPIAYSQGFSPHPQISYGPPLPVGVASSAEILDITLKQALPPSLVGEQLKKTVAPGVQILSVESVSDQAPALTAWLNSATYQAEFADDQRAELETEVARLLAQKELSITKKNEKIIDVRPFILGVRIDEGRPRIEFSVKIGSDGNLNPVEFSKLMPSVGMQHFQRISLNRRD